MLWSKIMFQELLGGPCRGRMSGDRDVDDPSTVVNEDDEDEQHPEGERNDDRDHNPEPIRDRPYPQCARPIRRSTGT
jgi:hypothetical protein